MGPWHLVPFREFGQRHARGRDVYREARKLITAYRLRRADQSGAVVMPDGGRVGDDADRALIGPLHQALVVALLRNNPSMLQDEGDDPNAGHKIATSENGLLYGHPLQGVDANRYVITEGSIVNKLDMRTAPAGRPFPPVGAPVGVPTPSLGLDLDEEYATAIYETVISGDASVPRLSRCIQWLTLAMGNSDGIDEATRVVAFRAGFEVLLGGGNTTELRRKLATLLVDDSRPKPRTWTERNGKERKDIPLRDSEWWFQSFSLLRNAIAHGDEIDEAQWSHADTGKRHWAYADGYARRAIVMTVIAAGCDPELEYDSPGRHLNRAYKEAEARRRIASSTDSR